MTVCLLVLLDGVVDRGAKGSGARTINLILGVFSESPVCIVFFFVVFTRVDGDAPPRALDFGLEPLEDWLQLTSLVVVVLEPLVFFSPFPTVLFSTGR